MPNYVSWDDIALRLVLTVVAGTLIGFDRGEHGRAAGLRTTLLVCLAASLAMIQANLLLPVRGKAPDSYVVMDLMRLPLGILSGMGFIGAGAILRRDNAVLGVTTAATLWFVTVIGLCLGGGQLRLGMIGLGIGMLVLQGLRHLEKHWTQDHQGSLCVVTRPNGPTQDEIVARVKAGGCKVRSISLNYEKDGRVRELIFQLKWRAKGKETRPLAFVEELTRHDDILKVAWRA